MKTRLCLVLGITAALGLSSCNEDRIISNTQLVKSISVSVQDFQDADAGTRAAYTVDGTGFHFTWSAGDTVGIYPVGGDQVAFPISNGEGSQTAKFDGGAWALRSSCSYAAYYPFAAGNYHVKETNLSVSYRGQTQNGNGSLDCLDNFDYQASVATRPDAEGNVNIALKHLGCFVRFQLTMPVADTLKSITLTSSKTPFIISGKYDLTQESIAITPSSTSETFSVSLSNTFTTLDNKILTVYAMMAPQDLSNSEIGILIKGTKYDSYTATVYGKNMLAGKAFNYKATVQSGTNISGKDVEWDEEGQEMTPSSIINFADERVKALCVSNWDTDGDGNLSIAEAAAVTHLRQVFKVDIFEEDTIKIKSFKELRYFTGLTYIGYEAFSRCRGLTSIVIPNSVTSIYGCAFEGCSSLTSITIPESVTSIGEYSFWGCSGLTSITIPESVTIIGVGAFSGCSSMTSISVSKENPVYDSRENSNAIIETINNNLICGCKNTIIPNSVTSIGDCAFDGCSSLTSIAIPNSVTSIGGSAFWGCSSLTSIAIPNSVISIGGYAFGDCYGLTSIAFLEGCSVSIGESAFDDCYHLASIEFPQEGSISIGEYAFNDCRDLTNIKFSGIKSIECTAFENCYLTSIEISSSVTSIAAGAFFDGDYLDYISVAEGNPVYDSRNNCNAIIETESNKLIVGSNNTIIPNSVTSIADYAFKDCSITSVYIPNSVVSIGKYAFLGGAFSSIIIPESVTIIEEEAFRYKHYLTDVYCYATNIPETSKNAFKDMELSVTLHVPEEAIEAYKATEPWKNFDAIVPLSASDSNPQYEYVDLGLSVKWATFNVGATKLEEYGDYFAWGETEPKTDYSLSTYKWCDGSNYTMTKYCNDSNYGNNGFTDTKTTLDLEDDVAHVKWGGSWRMPTKSEQDDLRNKCTWTWYSSGNTEFNGVAGYKVTSNIEGYTDRFIFLPAAGCRYETGLNNAGFVGYYRSSSLYTGRPYDAWYVDFDSSNARADYYYHRYYGLSVRPVCP